MANPALVLLALVLAAPAARADGERGPMVGGAIVGTRGGDVDVAGVGAEIVFWHAWLGVAVEGSRQWNVDDVHGPRVGSVAGSLRMLAFDTVMPSLLDSREVVELGIELQGIVERAWWDHVSTEREPVSYGFGVAVRLRGATDDDRSNLLAESRLFVRAMRSLDAGMDVAARDTMPSAERHPYSVIIGLGALWGGGESAYVDRLRRRNALDSEWLVR